MTGTITWEQLGSFMTLIAALAALWWRVEHRISSGAREAMSKAGATQDDLGEFKLEVARGYASVGLLKDVEGRVVARLDALVEEISGMRRDLQNALLALVKATSEQTAKPRK